MYEVLSAVLFLHRVLHYSLLEIWHLAGCY